MSQGTISARIAESFSAAGAQGYLHAREVGGADGPEVDVDADAPVVLASVFKLFVALGFAAEVSSGRLAETEQTTVGARYRIGGVGTAGCRDEVTMSWRDLALFMMSMSDNAATDVIWHRIGKPVVEQVIRDLHLRKTRLVGCCEDILVTMAQDLGFNLGEDDIFAQFAAVQPEQLWATSALDPARTSASTPREITTVLERLWTDQAASPAACAQVRALMGQQIWPHRLSSGFDSSVQIAGKIGFLPGVRNEVGVVTYPDGRRYAVAVFTRATSLAERLPDIDAAIGETARLALDHLRAV